MSLCRMLNVNKQTAIFKEDSCLSLASWIRDGQGRNQRLPWVPGYPMECFDTVLIFEKKHLFFIKLA